MNDSREREGWLKFGVAAELARHYGADERDFLKLLARLLEGALPGETLVERRGWFGPKEVRRIEVTLDDNRYILEDSGRGPLRAARVRVVRGIALKTEDLPVPQWIEELGAALDERAKTSQAAREALGRLVD